MRRYRLGNRISTPLRLCIAICVLFLSPFCKTIVDAEVQEVYRDKVIFTAPSAEKLFDGTPLTEQIDVTAQGLPEGFTYKAVAEGSVTYPEDNAENNNIVTDYVIFDPSGLNVTDKFVNVELRPGTLRVSEKEAVLGARRDSDEESGNSPGIGTSVDKSGPVVIDDEETAKAATAKPVRSNLLLDIILYSFLIVIMLGVFVVFILDSNKMRGK